jgi:hypothetical protein
MPRTRDTIPRTYRENNVTLRVFNKIRVNRYRYVNLYFYAYLVQCAYMKANYENDGCFETQIGFYTNVLVRTSIYYQIPFTKYMNNKRRLLSLAYTL